MKIMIEEISKQLTAISESLGDKELAEKDFIEEKDYLDDVLLATKELQELLVMYQHIPIADMRAGRINLIKFRNAIAEMQCYFNHASQQLDNFFERYPVPEEVENKTRVYCCKRMRQALMSEDNPVEYDRTKDEYSIRNIENIAAVEPIDYCLWCASRISGKSKRNNEK